MPESALEQLAAQLRGVLESVDTATAAVGDAWDKFGEARDVVVEATYGTEDAELVEGIEGMAHTVLDLERETERLGVVREVIERYLVSLGFDGRSASEPAVGVDRSEVRQPEFGSPEWLAEVGRRISPEAGVHVTTGIGFDDHGNELGSIRSGRDRLAAAVSQQLRDTPQFPSAGNPSGNFASSDHAETKYAMWMRENGVRQLTLVINHAVVCGGKYGCQRAVRALLPRGSTLTVYSSASGESWELRGVAPS